MRKKLLVLAFSALIAAGCSTRQAMPNLHGATPGVGNPNVRQTGDIPVSWRRFHWGGVNGPYFPTILVGPDKAMWYNDYFDDQLIRMTMTGSVTRFPLSSFNPNAFVVGNDGKFYVGSQGQAHIDVVTTAGAVNQLTIPSGDVVSYNGATLGPDHNVYMVEDKHVAKVTTGGTITEVTFSDASTSNYYDGITTGPDGNLWVTEYFNSALVKVTPGSPPTMGAPFALGCNPYQIASAGGFLWIPCTNNTLLQVNTSGLIINTWPTVSYGFQTQGNEITTGADGNVWFGTNNAGDPLGQFNVTTDALTYFYPPSVYAGANGLVSGPDGNMWTVDSNTRTVDVYIINVISASPSTLSFPATGQNQNVVVSESGFAAWTATSNNTAVATVAQGAPANTFVITSKGKGNCKVFISDNIGNSFVVRVTVL